MKINMQLKKKLRNGMNKALQRQGKLGKMR